MKINTSVFGLNEEMGFQMAPMIDIIFLLIIFFMVAANINQSERIKIEIPVASDATVPKDPGVRVNVTVDEKGQLFAGTRPVDEEGLAKYIEAQAKSADNLRVFLRADSRARHGNVRMAMKAIAEGGITDVIFATYQTGN
ncbi:MAG: biopolymer transporter ExbD [Terrimicrobiaceae bacterium]